MRSPKGDAGKVNAKDRAELERALDKLNKWEWPRIIGPRPPRCYTVEDNDDIRVAYRIMDALVRWSRRRS